MLQYDSVLILGDLNIHVCCPSSSSFTSFIKLLGYFRLTQYVKQPSHDKGHTLDLVLAHGFCVDEVNLVVFAISDHKAVLFQVPLLSPDPKGPTLIHSCHLNSLSIPCFSQAFMSSSTVLNTHELHDLTMNLSVVLTAHKCFRLYSSGQTQKAETSFSAMAERRTKNFKETMQDGREEMKKGPTPCLPCIL